MFKVAYSLLKKKTTKFKFSSKRLIFSLFNSQGIHEPMRMGDVSIVRRAPKFVSEKLIKFQIFITFDFG